MQTLRTLFLTLLILLPASANAARLAVLEINDLNIEQKVLAQISDGLREGALDTIRGSDADISVMTRESMLVMLDDMGIDPSCIEGECEVETARNIGADYVISATLLKLEGVWILSAKLHESEGGDLLATGKTEANGLLDLSRATSGVAGSLLAKGLGLYASSFGTSASPEAGTSGGAFGGLQMDVSGKLAEKRCGEEAEREGATIRREKMASAVAKAQSNATSAWNGMLADLEACTKLDYDDRAPCIDAVENWITVASKMEVTLPAGQEMVETDCGLKQTVFDVISQKVAVDELPDAKAMLIQLNVRVTDQLNVRVSDQLDVVVEHLLAGRSSIARDLLQRLLADNIGAPELDEVRYRLAESHFNEKNWGGAARAFQEVVEKHSNSQWAPWAMLRQGECFVAMGQHKNAMLFYQDLEYKYPKSEAAKHARSRMTKPLTNEDGKW